MRFSIAVTARRFEDAIELLNSIEKMDFDKDEYEVVIAYEEGGKKIPSFSFRMKAKKMNKHGIPAGRNETIKMASGDYIVFTDSDCTVPSNWLSVLEKYAKSNHDAIAGNARIVYNTWFGKIVSMIGYPAGGNLGFERVFDVKNGYAYQLSTCNAAIRWEIAKELGFDEELDGGEDKDISIKMRMKGYRIRYAPDWFVYHKSKDYVNEFVRWMLSRGKHSYTFMKKYGKTDKNWKKHIKAILSSQHGITALSLFTFGYFLQILGYISRKKEDIKKKEREKL
ncbi:MAG: glycosyltransferase [Thermoplasmata archaeon]|nr:glycosyltransferase [Thermoplasmata archaeon]